MLCPPSPTTNGIGGAPPQYAADRDAVSPENGPPGGVSPHSDAVYPSPTTNVISGAAPPPHCAADRDAVSPANRLPVVCPRCVSPVVCPRCLSPHCPSGVSPMAWLWCCCNRYSRSMRGPGSVPCEFQSATPVMCPPVMQSLRPERAGLGLSVSRAPECRPSGVSPAACPPTSSVVLPPKMLRTALLCPLKMALPAVCPQ